MAITHAQYVTMFQEVGELYRAALIEFGRATATKNVISLVNGIKDNSKGDFGHALSTRAATWRSNYASLVSSGRWKALLDPIFAAVLRDLADNKGNLDPSSNWIEITKYHNETGPYAIQTRGITFDASPTAAGSGDGTAYRLTVDRNGVTIEGVYIPLDISFRCTIVDNAAIGEETFEITVPAPTDILDLGSTISFDSPGTIQAQNSDGEFLRDHSFQLSTVAVADPSTLGAWVDSVGVYGSAKYALEATVVSITSNEETANGQALSLEVKGNYTIQQSLTGVDLFTPYFWSIRVSTQGTISAGDLIVHWGSKSQTIDLTAVSQGGTFDLHTIDLDKDCFGWNFAGDAGTALFELEISSLAGGGTVYLDTVRFRPFRFFGGHWWALESGATNFQSGVNAKTLVYNDVLAGADSVLGSLVHTAYGRYLNSAAAAATQITAAGGRTLTFANSGSADTITSSSGSFISDGYSVGMLVTVAGSSSNNGETGPIASLTATVLTFNSQTTLTNEGPLSATCTLDAAPSIPDPV